MEIDEKSGSRMMIQIEQLNQLSLRSIRKLFTTLDPPILTSLTGLQRGMFVGPAWLRASAGPLLAVTVLSGWWGKEINQDASGAVNLVLRGGEFHRVFPMVFQHKKSYLDGKAGLALRYQKDNPFPWPIILDELRQMKGSPTGSGG